MGKIDYFYYYLEHFLNKYRDYKGKLIFQIYFYLNNKNFGTYENLASG